MKLNNQPFNPNCCAVRERTADGTNVGRCWFRLDEKDICPRHGNVSELMKIFRETGKLQEDPRIITNKLIREVVYADDNELDNESN